MKHSDWWLENEKRNNMPFSHIVYAEVAIYPNRKTAEVGAFDETGRCLWFDPQYVWAFDRLVRNNQIMTRVFSQYTAIRFNLIETVIGEKWPKTD